MAPNKSFEAIFSWFWKVGKVVLVRGLLKDVFPMGANGILMGFKWVFDVFVCFWRGCMFDDLCTF